VSVRNTRSECSARNTNAGRVRFSKNCHVQ
jgi:hypothetical protein